MHPWWGLDRPRRSRKSMSSLWKGLGEQYRSRNHHQSRIVCNSKSLWNRCPRHCKHFLRKFRRFPRLSANQLLQAQMREVRSFLQCSEWSYRTCRPQLQPWSVSLRVHLLFVQTGIVRQSYTCRGYLPGCFGICRNWCLDLEFSFMTKLRHFCNRKNSSIQE